MFGNLEKPFEHVMYKQPPKSFQGEDDQQGSRLFHPLFQALYMEHGSFSETNDYISSAIPSLTNLLSCGKLC